MLNTQKLKTVLQRSYGDLVNFRYYLLTNGNDDVKAPDFHYKWSDILLNSKDNFAIEGFRESLPLDTEIPTPDGFKRLDELKVGDKVFNKDGKSVEIDYVSPVFDGKDCYRLFFDDNTQITCSGEHLWYVNDKKKRKIRNVPAVEMFNDYLGWEHKNGYREYRFRIPICGSVEYKEKDLPIDPYILGMWLGDGNTHAAAFTIGHRDIAEIKKLFTVRGIELCVSKHKDIRYAVKGLHKDLRLLNLLGNKHIPEIYLQASKEQRIDLLSGLIDSDGTVAKTGTKAGTVTFCNTNKRLALQVLELVRSLGWKATIIQRESYFNGQRYKDCYKVSFKPNVCVSKIKFKQNLLSRKDGRSSGKTIKKIEKVESVPCKCIGVASENGTYLVTRDYLVTHNSAKGQICLRTFPLYALRFPHTNRDYIVLIKQNATLASGKLLEIIDEYLSNPVLNTNIVEVKQKSAKVLSVDVKDIHGQVINVRIEAYGKGSAIRGLSNLNRRPKIVIIDDPQDLEDSRSDTVLDADWKWFISDVKFLGQYSRIFLIGNNLGEKCIIERVFNNADELDFKTMRIAIQDDSGNPAWPAKFNQTFIEQEREKYRKLGEIDTWIRERMCRAVSEESRTFDLNDFPRYSYLYVDSIVKDCNFYITVDPASSKDPGSCYRAIIVNAVHPDNRWTIVDCFYGRWQSDEFIDKIFEAVTKWSPYLGGVRRIPVGIERGHFKQILEPFIYKEMQRRNVFFNIMEIQHASIGSKLERVKMLAPRVKAKNIWLPEVAEWLGELEAELSGVTRDGFKSMYNDLVDTLSMQMQIAKPPVMNTRQEHGPVRVVAEEEYNPLEI